MKQFAKFTLEEEQKIRETKNSYFKLEMNNKWFKELVEETIDEMYDPNERITFKKKAVYLLQHLCEEYLVFWFLQLAEISEFAHRQTLMKADFELYLTLIHRLMQYDNLSFISEILKKLEDPQIAKTPISSKEIKSDLPEGWSRGQ